MQRSWCRALLAAAFVLATGSGASAATSVSIESAAPGSAARPAVVVVRGLAVPAIGATVTVCARAQGMSASAKLATAVILGGRTITGTRDRSFRSIIDAPAGVLDTLARDPHATITVIVTPTGHPEAATTTGPYAVNFISR